jgi:hypothetical protein
MPEAWIIFYEYIHSYLIPRTPYIWDTDTISFEWPQNKSYIIIVLFRDATYFTEWLTREMWAPVYGAACHLSIKHPISAVSARGLPNIRSWKKTQKLSFF